MCHTHIQVLAAIRTELKKTLMNRKELSELTDQELLDESKRIKPNPWLDVFLIGLLIGILVYGVVINSMGFLVIIPLFLIYVLIKKSKKQEVNNISK